MFQPLQRLWLAEYENGSLPNPPADYTPPIGASPYTWRNIYTNTKLIDKCVETYAYLKLRIDCINRLTGQSPNLV